MHGSLAEVTPIPALPRPASRLISRLLAETQLAMISDFGVTMEAVTGQRIALDRAIFLLMILRQDRRFQAASTGQAHARGAADASASGISVNAIATSLKRSFETVRRHINTLIAAGVLQRTVQGVVIAPAVLAHPMITAALERMHDGIVALVESLARSAVPLPATRSDQTYDPDATIATAIDLALAPFEIFAPHYENWREMAVTNIVVIVGARDVTHDPVMTRRYADADTVPPADIRRAISTAGIARGMRISHATARREVDLGIAAGRFQRVPGGVIATDAFLSGPTITNGGQHAAARAAQALTRLVPGGFRFDDPARCYIVGPPPLASYT